MFWITIELINPKMGLNIKLSFLVKNLTAFRSNRAVKYVDVNGNTNNVNQQGSLATKDAKLKVVPTSLLAVSISAVKLF